MDHRLPSRLPVKHHIVQRPCSFARVRLTSTCLHQPPIHLVCDERRRAVVHRPQRRNRAPHARELQAGGKVDAFIWQVRVSRGRQACREEGELHAREIELHESLQRERCFVQVKRAVEWVVRILVRVAGNVQPRM